MREDGMHVKGLTWLGLRTTQFGRRSPMPRGSSHRRGHGGIVGLDPGLHAFRRFHIKARLLSHQDKGLGHTKISWFLQW
jgi:hypothetical protein